jgi:hypothetical protein
MFLHIDWDTICFKLWNKGVIGVMLVPYGVTLVVVSPHF